jgi:hypothetical protein
MDGFYFSDLRSCRTLERLDRRIGQRRDATRAPNQARNGLRPSGRLLVTPPHHLKGGQILSNLWGPPQIGYPIVAFVSGAYLFQAVSCQGNLGIEGFLKNEILRFFGKYSYAIYLFHLPVRAALRDLIFLKPGVQQALGSALLVQGVFYLAATVAVLPVVLLSWNFFEKPFLSLKEKFA